MSVHDWRPMTEAERDALARAVSFSLGFDVREAVEAGIRRGWIVRPGEDPPMPQDDGQLISGLSEAAKVVGCFPSALCVAVREGKIETVFGLGAGRGHKTVFRMAELLRYKAIAGAKKRPGAKWSEERRAAYQGRAE